GLGGERPFAHFAGGSSTRLDHPHGLDRLVWSFEQPRVSDRFPESIERSCPAAGAKVELALQLLQVADDEPRAWGAWLQQPRCSIGSPGGPPNLTFPEPCHSGRDVSGGLNDGIR